MAMTPCSDGVTCESELSEKTSTTHDHSQDEDDYCTPFCVCLCCGTTFVIEKEYLCPSTSYLIQKKLDIGYKKSLYRFDFIHSVWHPPNFS